MLHRCGRRRDARHGVAEGGLRLFEISAAEGNTVKSVVGSDAPVRRKMLETFVQSAEEGIKAVYLPAAYLGKLTNAASEARLVDVDDAVGPEGGQHLKITVRVGGDAFMGGQRVGRIIGGADHANV